MDLQSSFFSLLLPFLLFIIFIVFVVVKRTKSKNKFPPGPWKLPIIGNLHQLLAHDLPHRRLRDLANKYGPLMSLQLGQVPHIIISSPEVAKQILKTHDTVFANRPMLVVAEIAFYNGKDIAFSPYGEYWRQMRNICAQELLHAKCVQSFRAVREEQVLNLITSCTSGRGSCVINLSKMLFSLSYAIVSKTAFGQIPKEQEESFREILDVILEVGGGFSIADLFPSVTFLQVVTGLRSKLEKLHQETDKILEDIISDHRGRKILGKSSGEHDDLVDILLNLQAQAHPPLSDNSIKAVIFDIFLGGSDTAATAAGWAMSELIRHPEMMEKAQAEVRQVFDKQGKVSEDKIDELNYLKLVIKETLRLHPPGPLLIPRESSEACEINGYHIPAKTRVIVNAWAIGSDPNYWIEAERFNPERFIDGKIDYKGSNNFEYLPFGGGRRICPGMLFGIAGVELPLASLLYHFDWKLPDGMKGESLDMVEAFGIGVGRKNDLKLIPVLHRPIPLAYLGNQH